MVEEQVEVVYVDPVKGDDRATGKLTEPLKTLTAALRQTVSTIRLSPGTYSIEGGEVFPLTIAAGVSIIGDPANRGRDITLVGGGKFNSPTFAQQSVTLLMEGDAQLRGVTITNSSAKGTGIWIESAESQPELEQIEPDQIESNQIEPNQIEPNQIRSEPTIASCTLRQCGREGIFVTGTAKPAIANCLFQGNLAGLAFVRSAKGEVRRCVVVDNGFGMVVSDRAAPLIVDSQFAENRSGLRLSGTSSPVLRRNAIEYNIREGLVVFGSAQPDLGNAEDGAENRFRQNGNCDLQNQTAIALISVGNWLNPARVTGAVAFPALQKLTRPGRRSLPTPPKAHPNWAKPFIQAIAPIIPDLTEDGFQPSAKVSSAAYEDLICTALDLQIDSNSLPEACLNPVLRPEAMTRLEAIVLLAKVLDLPPGNPSVLPYRDRAQIPSQRIAAVAAATQNRLVVLPQIDRLNPLAPITQAEAIAMIYQAGVMQGKFEAIVSPQIVSIPDVKPSLSAEQIPEETKAPVVVLQAHVPPAELQSSLRSSLQSSSPAAEIVLAIAQETLSLLQFQGIEAFLGRSDAADLSVSLQMAIADPAAIETAIGAVKAEDINGIAVSHPANSLESARLAQLIHKTILRHIDTRSHGVQTEEKSLPIAIPTISITVGFMTGTEDAINLNDAEYRRCMARAIAEGILHYVQFALLPK
ncbi:MAG: DUF1565 domain-containing protein [Drouetiella hepatica Uher 2000/2452]|uniref:DUF1565 domain-containing protein n=1 Tax=Drouetiella hepatica Uher 2000/2452 TaxID=904376 RepID=A0A951QEM2_9CYAN|nr:DUF1565 domain-containing protein [Drouetiella hepatica Uher 2000/2452]